MILPPVPLVSNRVATYPANKLSQALGSRAAHR